MRSGRELLALNSAGDNELHRAALAGNQIARAYADTVADLLSMASLAPEDIAAAGAHGQTVRHRPGEFDGTGYTLQLLNGALLAELCGVDVVCDFRSRDVAAGGQGAPLGTSLSCRAVCPPRGIHGRPEHRRHRQPDLAAGPGPGQRLRLRARQRADGRLVRAAHRSSLRPSGPVGGWRPSVAGLAAPAVGYAISAACASQEARAATCSTSAG